MSQIYKSSASSPSPPDVPTTFVTDENSPAVPAANILNTPGGSTTENNDNGIQTDGSSGSNTLTVELTNRLVGTVSTVGNTEEDILTFSLGAVAGSYKFEFEVIGFESSTPAASGYAINATARTDGAAATIVAEPDADEDEDMALIDEADWDVVASGNDVVVRVTGVTGLTINWKALGTYIFVG